MRIYTGLSPPLVETEGEGRVLLKSEGDRIRRSNVRTFDQNESEIKDSSFPNRERASLSGPAWAWRNAPRSPLAAVAKKIF